MFPSEIQLTHSKGIDAITSVNVLQTWSYYISMAECMIYSAGIAKWVYDQNCQTLEFDLERGRKMVLYGHKLTDWKGDWYICTGYWWYLNERVRLKSYMRYGCGTELVVLLLYFVEWGFFRKWNDFRCSKSRMSAIIFLLKCAIAFRETQSKVNHLIYKGRNVSSYIKILCNFMDCFAT